MCIRAVEIHNAELKITNPTGDYLVMESVLSLTSVVTNPSACSQTTAENCSFELNIKESIIPTKGDFSFMVNEDSNQSLQMAREVNYHSIRLSIVNSTMDLATSTALFGQRLSILIHTYPMQLCTVEVSNVTFSTYGVRLEMPLGFSIENTTSLSSADKLVGAHVLIDGCKFLGTARGITIVLHNSIDTVALGTLSSRASTTATERTRMKHLEIIIENTTFQDCIHGTHIIGQKIIGNMNDVPLFVSTHRRLLTVQNSTFKNTKNWFGYQYPTLATIVLTDLQGYRVVMAGGNYITSNEGYGLALHNSQVELHGYNEISNNSHRSGLEGGGIYMSSDSQLLLTPGTVLNVTANNASPYGGGIYISHHDRYGRTMSLAAFVDCYVEFHDCPGWCFFQFINSDGQSVNASELAEHNATVLLSNNTASHGGNNVFNGHFQNYSLQTADVNGTLPASRQLILDVFHQYPPMDEEPIPSYPYAICLCIDGELNCIRNHTLVIETYPVQTFPISVHIMGDWQRVLPVRFIVDDDSATHTDTLSKKNCTDVYTLGNPTPGSSHHIRLQAYLDLDASEHLSTYIGILHNNLLIKVFNSCSPGLVYKEHECTCNAFLKHHMFTCTVRTTTATYRADQPHESTQSQQCINDHQGLLCSECPPSYKISWSTR